MLDAPLILPAIPSPTTETSRSRCSINRRVSTPSACKHSLCYLKCQYKRDRTTCVPHSVNTEVLAAASGSRKFWVYFLCSRASSGRSPGPPSSERLPCAELSGLRWFTLASLSKARLPSTMPLASAACTAMLWVDLSGSECAWDWRLCARRHSAPVEQPSRMASTSADAASSSSASLSSPLASAP